ncbi:MAG TPA: DUF2269 family protein [Acidimicrobiia bacterium]|nr:DUF2269 family protein [Acidimicrobiia bacterium]
MEFHEVLKFVHVAAAIVWVGGAVTLELFGGRTARRGDTGAVVAFSEDAQVIGRIYGLATALVLAMGIWMVIDSPAIEFSDAWILISLILTAVMFVAGPGFFEPTAKKIGAAAAEHGGDAPQTKALISRMMVVGRLDSLVAFFIVWLMVVKPGA